jgi:hypothetical protein
MQMAQLSDNTISFYPKLKCRDVYSGCDQTLPEPFQVPAPPQTMSLRHAPSRIRTTAPSNLLPDNFPQKSSKNDLQLLVLPETHMLGF